MAFLDETGLAHFWNQILARLNKFVPAESGKGLSTNDYTDVEKAKLASIADNAEVNQNAFSSIIVGSTTISADSKTDTLTVEAGDNITLAPYIDSDKITISAVDTTYSTGTSSISGLTKLYSETGVSTDGTMTQHSITSALSGKVDTANGQYAVTTGGDGTAYTATVPGITTLTTGASFIMIPHVVSTTTTPTLDVNGLGAKNIKRRLTSIATSSQNGYTASWLGAGLPFRVVYDGSQWIVEGHGKPAGPDVYGTVPKATADADGNDIVNTYATKVELQSYLSKSTTISLPAASWTGSSQPYSQVVTINGVTVNSKVDLQPTAVQIVELQNAHIMLMTENDAGTITVYALGEKPTSDYTMQVLITETLPV